MPGLGILGFGDPLGEVKMPNFGKIFGDLHFFKDVEGLAQRHIHIFLHI